MSEKNDAQCLETNAPKGAAAQASDTPLSDAVKSTKPRRNGVTRSRKDRRYSCSTCQESFTRSEHLHRHELSHRNQKPYACSQCPLTSTRKDVISRHVKKFHGSSGAPNSHLESFDASPRAHGTSKSLETTNQGTSTEPSQPALQNSNETILNFTRANFAIGAPPTPSTNASAGCTILDVGYDGSWQHPHTSNTQANANLGDDQSGLRTDIDFRILDDYFFQYFYPEPAHFALPLEDPQRQAPDQRVDAGSSSDHDYQSNGLFLELSPADIQQAELNVAGVDVENRLGNFTFCSRYKAIRFLKGFFTYFSPHTPIVHAPTFNIATSPAPLVLAVLACGAIHVNETSIGTELHHSVLRLLAQNEHLVTTGKANSTFELWEFQTRLLACQFGLFSGDDILQRQARLAFARLPILAQEASVEARMASSSSREDWITRETINRCVAWVKVLSAVLLSDDENVTLQFRFVEPDVPLPCSEGLWAAPTVDFQQWPKVTISSAESFRRLLSGSPVDGSISPFGLLTLISTILSYICSMRGMDERRISQSSGPEEGSIELALRTWEEAWKRHPHSTSLPEAPHGPLMADSILILNTSYYHLYASDQLRELKSFARSPVVRSSRGKLEELYTLPCHPRLAQSLARASRSLLIRVRLGIRHLMKTASLSYACYGPIPAYEGGLLLCWYLLGQRLLQNYNQAEPIITDMMDEIVAESEGAYRNPIRRELLPLLIYQDLLRERWVWKSSNILCNNLGNVIQQLETVIT